VTAGLRKFVLTLHVTASVAWIGAVAVFLALAIIGFMNPDVERVRASYVAMDSAYSSVVVPLGLASVVTGIVSSLDTEWGLFRYYWVLVKILLSVPAIILMLVHARPVSDMARAAGASIFSGTELTGLRIQLIAYACVALIVLLVATGLSTYKPRGRTPFGARRREPRTSPPHQVELEMPVRDSFRS
jgi:putative copper export protein